MIITDEALLRTPCGPVLPGEVVDIRQKLEAELKLSGDRGRPGIGLAGPQIGIFKKFAIIRVTGTNGKQYNIDLVNARIANGYDEVIFRKEGCLSFPGKFVNTKRYMEILVVDNMVEPYSFIASGLLSCCCAHEIDHINGILLPDLVIK
jgi:peptide deformylase